MSDLELPSISKANQKIIDTRSPWGREQYHFEFSDWEEAFKMFYRKKKQSSEFCLVISTAFYTQGYWIEMGAKKSKEAYIYKSLKQVMALEVRVRRAIKEGKRGLIL